MCFIVFFLNYICHFPVLLFVTYGYVKFILFYLRLIVKNVFLVYIDHSRPLILDGL